MISCTNKLNGCPKWFTCQLGLRTHLRSCTRGSESTNGSKKCSDNVSTFLEKDEYGYQCTSASESAEYSGAELDEIYLEEDYECQKDEKKVVLYSKYDHLSASEKNLASFLCNIAAQTGQKKVDNIFRLLKDENFILLRFLDTFTSSQSCAQIVNEELEIGAVTSKFMKKRFTDDLTNLKYDVYYRSPVQVLRSQIEDSSGSSSIFNPPVKVDSEIHNISHPMMAALGTSGVPVVKASIMERQEDHIYWRTPSHGGERSFVGMVQVYSDKSRTSLKESGFRFYPLHITLLNFSEQHRRHCIVKGLTFVAFIPVNFEKDLSAISQTITASRTIKMRLVQQVISFVLAELATAALPGFACTDGDQKKRRCHPCISSYCCDLPEAKDMTAVKNGNSSLRNCHRCMAQTNLFNTYTKERLKTGSETLSVIQEALKLKGTRKNDQAQKLLAEHSLGEHVPWLLQFPFIGQSPELDLHQLFSYEPLHNLHLGISKDLKRYLAERLRSEKLRTCAIPTFNGKQRTCLFKSIRSLTLNGINRMLKHIENYSHAKGLHINFSSEGKSDQGNGLYGDDGRLTGMIEGAAYRTLDYISPFIGLFADRCCDEISESPTNNVFTQYADLVQNILCYDGNSKWDNNRIENLEKDIARFKADTLQLYGDHSSSQLRTEKFHILDHVVQDIRRLGGISWGDAGLYEYTHTLVKSAYRCGSKRKL